MLDVFVRLYVYMWPKNRTGAQGASPRRFHIIYDRTALAAMLVPVIERSDPLGWGRVGGRKGVEIGRRRMICGEDWGRGEGERARTCRPRAVSCVSWMKREGGCEHRGGVRRASKGGRRPWRIRGTGGMEMAMGGARMAFCGQFSMCLYAVMCYRFPPPPPPAEALLPTYLPIYLPTFMPHGIVTSIPSYAR